MASRGIEYLDPDIEKFDRLLTKAGYRSRRQFAVEALGVPDTSLHNNLKGIYGLSVNRCIKIANGLKVPVDEVIDIFYPDLYATNKEYQ